DGGPWASVLPHSDGAGRLFAAPDADNERPVTLFSASGLFDDRPSGEGRLAIPFARRSPGAELQEGSSMTTRRVVLAGIAALAASAMLPPLAARAQDADGAAAFIESMAREAIGVLETVGTGSEAGQAEFARIFRQSFDVP